MTLTEKLQAGAEDSALVLGSPASRARSLGELAASMKVSQKAGKGPYGLILIYAEDSAALAAALEKARPLLIGASLLWFAYPKRPAPGSGLGDETGWTTLKTLGFQPIKRISLDGDWSALRFKHISKD
jgi:hypothetical protein